MTHRGQNRNREPASADVDTIRKTLASVREIEHRLVRVLEQKPGIGERSRAEMASRGDVLDRDYGEDTVTLFARPLPEARAILVERFERAYVRSCLEHCGGNVSRAARQAGVTRQTFYALLHRLALWPNSSKNA